MINGIINVYKEKGYTSFDVVAKLRGILKTKKIGHTGTLDPDAEGVLPVCLGKATKVCDLLTDKNKEYVAVMLLGKVTDTQDTTGTNVPAVLLPPQMCTVFHCNFRIFQAKHIQVFHSCSHMDADTCILHPLCIFSPQHPVSQSV